MPFDPKSKGRRIPPGTWVTAVLGGMVPAYLSMAVLVALIPGRPAEKLILPMIIMPLAWSGAAIWIFHSPTFQRAAVKCAAAILVAGVGLTAFMLLE